MEETKKMEGMRDEEVKAGMRILWKGLVIPTVICYLLMALPASPGGLHIYGWGALVLAWWIVAMSVIYNRKMDRIQTQQQKK